MLAVWQSAFAQTQTRSTRRSRLSPTIDVQYQEPDTGRSRVQSILRKQIDALNREPTVLDVRIPILIGVTVADLEDTWGDARSEGRTHEGIDILVPRGSLIVSPTEAVVTTVANSGNGGNHVFTANPGGERFYFAHLDSFATSLKEGQVLKAGDLIGYVGNTGNASAGPTHLHFGIYENDHDAINPFPRLTLPFSLKDKIKEIVNILNDSNNATTLARSLTNQYRSTFLEAQASGIKLPAAITQALTEKIAEVQGIVRILQLGSRGDDVKSLQGALGIVADGNFGPKTRAAVIAFQTAKGLTADGVFGSKSRALLAVGGVPCAVPLSGPVCPNGMSFSSNCTTSC